MDVGEFGLKSGRMGFLKTVVLALVLLSLLQTGNGEDPRVGFPGLTGDVMAGGGEAEAAAADSLQQVLQGLLSDPATLQALVEALGQIQTGDGQASLQDLLAALTGDQAQSDLLQAIIEQLLIGQEPGETPSLEEVLQQLKVLLENPISRALIEQYLNQVLGDFVTIPDGLLDDIADRIPSTLPPGTGDLFQQLQGLLTGNATGIQGLLGSLLNSTDNLDDVIQLLQGFGFMDEDLQVNWEQVASQVGQEMLRYVELNLLVNVTSPCLDHTLRLLNDTANASPYAIQMMLSNGDFLNVEAVTTYNIVSLGNVEQCQQVTAWNPDAPFETEYCSMGYSVSTPLGEVPFVVGICVPASCSPADLKEMFQMVQVIGDNTSFDCLTPYPWDAASIATLCLLWVFLLLITCGLVYHVFAHYRVQANIAKARAVVKEREAEDNGKKDKLSSKEREINGNANGVISDRHVVDNSYEVHENTVDLDLEGAPSSSTGSTCDSTEKIVHVNCTCALRAGQRKIKKLGFLDAIMMSLSPIHNGAKILNTEKTEGSLGVLNGIRVISMWWIILGHTIYFGALFIDNPRYVQTEVLASFWISAIVYSTVSVDTFFFLSGLLLTYLTLKHLKKVNGRMNWGLFYLHRFIRITPAYMLVLAVSVTLIFHFGEGPGKTPFFEAAASNCRSYWWTNLLYISNLYPFPGDLGLQCLGWSWYLSNDMQFFIISPFILYLLYKHSKLGLALITAMCLGSFAITAYLAYHYGVAVGLRPAYNNRTLIDYGTSTPDIIYSKPYCRIPTYLIGMITGYILFKWIGRPFKLNMWVNGLLWLVAFGTGLAVIYGPYREGNQNISQALAVVYTVLSRPAFVIAVGWVVFACTMGYGGPVTTFLSWGFWAPLSRITFGAYLLHPFIIFVINTTLRSQFHFTYMQYASWFVSYTVFSYAAAFILSIGVEGPIIGLEKTLLGRGKGGKK